MHATQVLAVAIGQQVVPARAQMATTLGFHIILACFGIAFPTIVLVAEFCGLTRSDDVAMLLARRWSQVMGVLVAVGAVTGTVLSFEMGLLWPGLMRTYGAVLGVPFGFEGIFFSVAPALRPPAVTLIHLAFDAMIGLAFVLLLAGLWALWVWWRRRALPRQGWFWWLGIACGPAALVAMECGWIVTEVGRQPWVVYQLMTTSAAATTNGGVIDSLTAVIILYAVLGVATLVILRMLARRWRQGPQADPETGVPYGPPEEHREPTDREPA